MGGGGGVWGGGGGVGGPVLNSDRLLFLRHRGLKPIMGTACGPRSPWVFSLVCKESVNRLYLQGTVSQDGYYFKGP